MLVSIIIPSYRQPQFLERAISSCLEQDHDELEVIVVEDRSGDASLGIAVAMAHEDPRVRVISCPTNGGLGKARNIGIAHARGDLLCFLDSDDYLLDRSLSARIEAWPAAVAEYGDAVVGVYGDWQHVPESIDDAVVRQPRQVMPLVSAGNYTGENVFICSAPLVTRDAVVDAGGFPEGLRMLEDFALWAKVIAAGGVFVPVRHVVSTYRQRPNSMLRGDGIVVMADHADVINDWVIKSGGVLADGGAMTAWLEDRDPRSFGRMSWSVPSILGNFGGALGAAAVANLTEAQAHDAPPVAALEDFMGNPRNSGLVSPPPIWEPDPPALGDLVVLVSSVQQALEAVTLVHLGQRVGRTIAVAASNPSSWFDAWPLALAGVSVRGMLSADLVVDLGAIDLDPDMRTTLVSHAVSTLWPDDVGRAASCVYVSEQMAGHPAIDAWLTTALNSLADSGEEPVIVADPRARRELRGYRSEVTSIDRLRGFAVIVASACSELSLLSAVAPTVVFDPFVLGGDHAKTRSELDDAIESLDRAAPRSTFPSGLERVDEIEALLQRLEEQAAP